MRSAAIMFVHYAAVARHAHQGRARQAAVSSTNADISLSRHNGASVGRMPPTREMTAQRHMIRHENHPPPSDLRSDRGAAVQI